MRFCTAFLLLLSAVPTVIAAPVSQPFLKQHCLECHDSEVKKGGLDLTTLNWKPDEQANFELWVKVHDRVQAGEMPPAKKPRPDATELSSFLKPLDQGLHNSDAARLSITGRTILRRLNRAEYERTVRDLLGVSTRLADILPEDTPMNGFDTVADGLRLSTLQIEKYLEAADTAIEDAIVLAPRPEPVSKRFFFKDEQNVRKNLDTPVGTITDKNARDSKHRHLMRELPEAIVFFNEGYPPAEVRQWQIRTSGVYQVRISGYGYQSKGHSIPIRVYADNFREKRLLGWFDMPADKARTVVITAALKQNEHLLIQPSGTGRDSKGQGIYNTPVDQFDGPGLALQWIEVEGPTVNAWPPASLKNVFGDTPIVEVEEKKRKNTPRGGRLAYEVAPADPRAALLPLIERFATRAFRRPLDKDEALPFVKLALAELDHGSDFIEAMRVGLRGVLTAPQFLLFTEPTGKLDAWALASRLSYAFWSTLPDEELLKHAADGSLLKPETLRAEAHRLLADPRSTAFVQNFAGQWLDLRRIDATTPDKRLYPEFDELLQLSMVAETEAFFREVLSKDLAVMNFISSDFAMLNSRLALHYGIPGVEGETIRRVPLPADSPRGGVLAQASILKVTANGTTTSPVLRGAWVMKHILGITPPPPPANVGSIEPDTRGATTVREQLAKHRTSESCAGCHKNIDPPGFALESFDVIGGWRAQYRSMEKGQSAIVPGVGGQDQRIRLGLAVDASGELPDGTPFASYQDFKRLLLARQELVVRALADRLITYTTGAGIRYADRQELDAITARAIKQGGGLQSLLLDIVTTPLFTHK